MTESADKWVLQRARRNRAGKKAWYYQVVCGTTAKGRVSVSLGYLSDDEATRARGKLTNLPPREKLNTVVAYTAGPDGARPPVTRADITVAVKSMLFDRDAADVAQELADKARDETMRALARGDFGNLPLRTYYEEIWKPIRANEIAPHSWNIESRSCWPAILEALGDTELRDLDMRRWDAFLTSKTTWGGSYRHGTQNAYRQSLKYAVEIGAIDTVHSFRPIKGATKRSLPPAEPLTMEEVQAVLEHASGPMHRALFAYAIGQGLRPGETTKLQWEDVDWEEQEVRIRGSKTAEADATVPLMPLTEKHLRAWWVECKRPTEGLAFTWKGEPLGSWGHAWRRTCKDAGIEKRCFPYQCRHTFATLAVHAGATPAAIRAMMRHTSRSTILEDAYTRLNASQVRDGMKPFMGSTFSK